MVMPMKATFRTSLPSKTPMSTILFNSNYYIYFFYLLNLNDAIVFVKANTLVIQPKKFHFHPLRKTKKRKRKRKEKKKKPYLSHKASAYTNHKLYFLTSYMHDKYFIYVHRFQY